MAKQKYRIFEGLYTEQMPELIKVGFKPLTISDIMQERLNGNLSFDDSYSSVSGIAYLEDKFKVIPHSKELEKVNPETILDNSGIKITPEEYNAIQAKDLTKKPDINFNSALFFEQVLYHPGWNELVQDKKLLRQYSEEVFKQVKDRCGSNIAMAFALSKENQHIPNLRAFSLCGLDKWSHADGFNLFDYENARLVGVKK